MKNGIGFIGGGNMAEGIIRGLLQTGTKQKEEIFVKELLPKRRKVLQDAYGVMIADQYRQLADGVHIIVLAVRPQDAKETVKSLADAVDPENHILVSICAGIRIRQIAAWLGKAVRIARIMPNTMIDSRRGYSALTFSEGFTQDDEADVQLITDAIGKTLRLPEHQFDAFTATSCAGPEWLILFATALVDAAVETGLSRESASKIVYENLQATGQLLASTGKHPIQITDEMNTPGGIGIAGFHVYQKGSLHGITMDAVNAAYQRTVQLGISGEE